MPPKKALAGGGAAAFWMPLIALFEGAREEEIGQLLTADIKTSAWGTPYFDLTTIDEGPASKGWESDDPEKSLKTPSSKRKVPIHQALIGLGFLDYVAARRKKGDRRLFPKLIAYRGRCTKNWSRWWGRYFGKHVTNDESCVFHSFRHTFTDALREAKTERDAKKALLGHSATDVTDGYGDGFSVEALNDEIQKIKYRGLGLVRLGDVAKNYLDG